MKVVQYSSGTTVNSWKCPLSQSRERIAADPVPCKLPASCPAYTSSAVTRAVVVHVNLARLGWRVSANGMLELGEIVDVLLNQSPVFLVVNNRHPKVAE